MSKRDVLRLVCATIIWLPTAAGNAEAGGLSTQLGEVVIENLQVGREYSLNQLANQRLAVTNKSDVGVHLKMDVLVPSESELKQGARPVPDESWVELSDSLFRIDAGDKVETDILIRIPDDSRHLGRKYQVMIWSHSMPGENGGMLLACGLKSRIIFTIDTIRAEIGQSPNLVMGAPAFLLEPDELIIDNVPAGEMCKSGDNPGTRLMITNTSNTTRTFRVISQTVGNSKATLVPGYQDTPNSKYLSFSHEELTLEPGQMQKVEAYLSFPDEPELKGKRYMFIVHVFSTGGEITSGKYSRVFATVR